MLAISIFGEMAVMHFGFMHFSVAFASPKKPLQLEAACSQNMHAFLERGQKNVEFKSLSIKIESFNVKIFYHFRAGW